MKEFFSETAIPMIFFQGIGVSLIILMVLIFLSYLVGKIEKKENAKNEKSKAYNFKISILQLIMICLFLTSVISALFSLYCTFSILSTDAREGAILEFENFSVEHNLTIEDTDELKEYLNNRQIVVESGWKTSMETQEYYFYTPEEIENIMKEERTINYLAEKIN